MLNNIKKLLREGLIKEDNVNGVLSGYHLTTSEHVESIMTNGLTVGHRGMQGKGIYGFYDLGKKTFNYGRTHISHDKFCVIKFEVKKIGIFILNKEISKDILGSSHDIITQVERVYGSIDEFIETLLSDPENKTREVVVNTLRRAYDKNEPMAFTNLSASDSVIKNGMVFDGEYGLQWLITDPNIIKVVGWHEYDNKTGELSGLKRNRTYIDKIKADEKYTPLFELIDEYGITDVEEFRYLHKKIQGLRDGVRNNTEFNYYTEIIDLLNTLL